MGMKVETQPEFCFANPTSDDKVHFDLTEIDEFRVRRFVHDSAREFHLHFQAQPNDA